MKKDINNKTLAIIPARGGSKRIPHKNIKPFLGNPIIKYSIKIALESECFDEVMVSTDDKDIVEISKSFGAQAPFLRSAKTSDDAAGTAEVLEEVLFEYRKEGKEFDYCCCLYPTAIFVTSKKIIKGFKILLKTGADSVVPVVRFSYPIQRSLEIRNGRIKMVWPENYSIRSQDCTPRYHDAGQFYWFRVKSFLKQRKLFCRHTVSLEIPESEVQDIDNLEDWKIAEIKYKILKGIY